MRRLTRLALVFVLLAAAVAAYRSRRAGERVPKPDIGVFANGMAYARLGSGPKTALLIPGGPGNEAPSGMTVRMFTSQVRPLLEEGYSIWHVTRKRGMPTGYTMADIADDYAGLIEDEFGGRVDLIAGTSFGGMVGFYIAADHPRRFGHIAIVVAGYAVTERGKALDLEFARHLSEGRTGEAMATMLEGLAPRWVGAGFARLIGLLAGRFAFRHPHPDFESDVLVEAEAEVACDARDVLPRISVPVLLVCGDEDVYFSGAVYRETARLIPDCRLRMYEGKGHVRVASDKRIGQDVLDFVHRDEPLHRSRPDVRAAETEVASA